MVTKLDSVKIEGNIAENTTGRIVSVATGAIRSNVGYLVWGVCVWGEGAP